MIFRMGDMITFKCCCRSTLRWGFCASSCLKIRVPTNTTYFSSRPQAKSPRQLAHIHKIKIFQSLNFAVSDQLTKHPFISAYKTSHGKAWKSFHQESLVPGKQNQTPKKISSNFLLIILSQEKSGTVLHIQRHKKRRFYLVDDLLINGFQTVEVIYRIFSMTDETHCGNNLKSETSKISLKDRLLSLLSPHNGHLYSYNKPQSACQNTKFKHRRLTCKVK